MFFMCVCLYSCICYILMTEIFILLATFDSLASPNIFKGLADGPHIDRSTRMCVFLCATATASCGATGASCL